MILMNKITILAVFAIFAGTAILATGGLTAFTTALAQTTMDNATMAGNMTGGNMTESATNDTGAISTRRT